MLQGQKLLKLNFSCATHFWDMDATHPFSHLSPSCCKGAPVDYYPMAILGIASPAMSTKPLSNPLYHLPPMVWKSNGGAITTANVNFANSNRTGDRPISFFLEPSTRKKLGFLDKKGHITSFIFRKHRLPPICYNTCPRSNSLAKTKGCIAANGNEEASTKEAFKEALDIVILSNGPGEVVTWVRPVVRALRRRFGEDRSLLRISVVLAPCPHASGKEMELIRSYREVDRCQAPHAFNSFLIFGTTLENWEWRKCGVCIFLGGDQFNTVVLQLVLSKRLGYRSIIYAEDAVRWVRFADLYALRSSSLLEGLPGDAQSRCRVVGDLFADSIKDAKVSASFSEPMERKWQLGEEEEEGEADAKETTHVVGLLPGSKGPKLILGVPFLLAVADALQKRMGKKIRFLIPMAPTVDLSDFKLYASISTNPVIKRLGWASGEVIPFLSSDKGEGEGEKEDKVLQGMEGIIGTENGTEIELWRRFPPYELLQKCSLCVTTIGTNTAELGCLGVPMVVVLPTQKLEVFRGATGGILGLLAMAPGSLGDWLTQKINAALLQSAGFLAWPNRWADEEVVPELIGNITPEEVAAVVEKYFEEPKELIVMRDRLLALSQERGQGRTGGAADSIAEQVKDLTLGKLRC